MLTFNFYDAGSLYVSAPPFGNFNTGFLTDIRFFNIGFIISPLTGPPVILGDNLGIFFSSFTDNLAGFFSSLIPMSYFYKGVRSSVLLTIHFYNSFFLFKIKGKVTLCS